MSQVDSNPMTPETQQQRWLKYGGNVVLVTVIVIALAVAAVYISEKRLPKKVARLDTTSNGLYSLKPQTLSVIKDNKQKITIISLYTKARQVRSSVDETADENSGISPIDKPSTVSDLLDEYRTQGSNISTETIDPDANPGKVEDLISDVMKNYGGEVEKYKAFTDSVPGKYDIMTRMSDAEVARIRDVFKQMQGQLDDVDQSVVLAAFSVQELPTMLKQGKDEYERALKLKVPDYKKVTDSVSDNMTGLSQLLAKVIDGFNHSKDDAKVPQVLRDYMVQSLPRYTELKKQADDLLAAEKGLGELKLDTLRDALKQKNPILVRGKDEWRVIPYEKVWKTDARRGNGGSRPQFAGEQMITTAILSLNQPTKPKVCFVRAGGAPITDFGGRLNSIADRLRDYNFDVSEKDLSGTYAMQAMQQQQQAPPEPGDAEIDDAVWVVDGVPAQSNPMMGGAPPGIASKIADHLVHGHHWVDGKKEEGGSAFVLFVPSQGAGPGGMEGDNTSRIEWTAALKPWGIEPRTDAVAMHQFIESEGEADTNIVNVATHNPMIFTFTEWGDHPITRPIASLMGLLLQAVPIQTSHVDGVMNTPLIPVPGTPSNPESWGAVNPSPEDSHPKFDRKKDIAPPIYCGAVAEKAGQRLVCMGSEATLTGSTAEPQRDLVDWPDQELQDKKHLYAPQFPGSAEFFMNSVFWLSHQETMIAISPSAMNVSRIREIRPVTLAFWHIGVLLIGLPGLVIAGGAFAYFSRQD